MKYHTEFNAWAIVTGERDKGFIGRYWHFGQQPKLQSHIEGCRVALFQTRALARYNLPFVKDSFPKSKVVQVTIYVIAK